ncbi:MAG: hypothetical protein J6Q67_04590, partial [Clostridia bacterium]|nr:hypothetical protein [Clostridia bacterium]
NANEAFAKMSDNSVTASKDVFMLKASLAFDMKASMPSINDEGRIYLKNARHPLLDRKKVVPVTIPLGADYDTLIITGPNTGGKTVTIKTVGLLTLMAMCGMMLPVSDGSEISVFNNILADIGDEQSIEQSLSTFSAHMTKIVSILSKADNRSLVLIDELGAGTDPVEGAALATAILMKLRENGAKIAATTHYAELKTFALETNGVCNASCEFSVETLMPTYRLIVGMPGRSNAFAISERLGLEKGIVDKARGLVTEENTRFERVVQKLEEQIKTTEAEKAHAMRIRSELEAMKAESKRKADELKLKQDKYMEKAREQAAALVVKASAEAEKLLSEMESIKKSSDSTEERIRKARAAVKSGVSRMQDAADPIESNSNEGYVLPRPLKKGDRVRIANLRKDATVLEDPTGDEVMIITGVIKTKVPLSNLRLIDASAGTPAKKRSVKPAKNPDSDIRTAASEIDIRGMTGDEAALELDRFIDNSVIDDASQSGLNVISFQNICWVLTIGDQFSPEIKNAFLSAFGKDIYEGSLKSGFSVADSLYPQVLSPDPLIANVGFPAYNLNKAKSLMSSAVKEMENTRFPKTTLYYYGDENIKPIVTSILGHWQQNLSAFINIEASDSLDALKNQLLVKDLPFAVFPITCKSISDKEYLANFGVTDTSDFTAVQSSLLENKNLIPIAFENTNIVTNNFIKEISTECENGYIDFSFIIKEN